MHKKEYVRRLCVLDIRKISLFVFRWNRQRGPVFNNNPASREYPYESFCKLKHITLFRRILKRNQTRFSPALRLCHMTKARAACRPAIAQDNHIL